MTPPRDPQPPEPGSREDLGLDKPLPTDTEAEEVEEEGEPFDGNFA